MQDRVKDIFRTSILNGLNHSGLHVMKFGQMNVA